MDQIRLSHRFKEQVNHSISSDEEARFHAEPNHLSPYNPGVPYGVHAQKVLDILEALRQESRIFQYTGMSDEEIFRTIHARYNKAFGGNLSGAMYGGLGAYMQVGRDQWCNLDVWSQMNDEITVHVHFETAVAIQMPQSTKIVELEKEALYGHLMPEIRVRYICSKYPGKQTVLEYCSYLRDMSQAGIIMKEMAAKLAIDAYTGVQRYAEATMDLTTIDCFSQVLDYASDIMITERLETSERFLTFLEHVENEIDRIHYKTYLGNFLRTVGKNWPNDQDSSTMIIK